MDQKELSSLKEKLLATEHPDREIDHLIEKVFGESREGLPTRHYTSSIDAALGLGRRCAKINVPSAYQAAVDKIPGDRTSEEFIHAFARLFCLEVVEKCLKHE